jgi:hypothetical protein
MSSKEEITQEADELKPVSVGEEVASWAEKYWRLKESYIESARGVGETSPYDLFRNALVDKINNTISERLEYPR